MSFYCINVETIEKCKNCKKNVFGKKYTSPSNEIVLHAVEAIGKCIKIKFKKKVQAQLMSSYIYIYKK